MTPPRLAAAQPERLDTVPTLVFPVIRGVQAQREFYVAMWSLRMMKQVSIFNEDELPTEMRA